MKSKRLTPKVTKTGVEVIVKKCRKCMVDKSKLHFYEATDTYFDGDGLFSVCKQCVNESFDRFLTVEGSVEKALLRICRALNLKYDEKALQATIVHLETAKQNGKIVLPPFMGVYKLKLTTTLEVPMADKRTVDLSYQEVTTLNINVNNTDVLKSGEVDEEVVRFWGANLELEDYRWLERELDDWKATHKSDTKAERTLLKEIVRKQFAIEKATASKLPTGNLVKELQEIMKTAAIDPSKSNAANAGKSVDTFGNIIKMIEDTQPADYYKDKELFKDFDNIRWYFLNYIVRPIKNFIIGSRDFSISAVSEEDDILDENVSLEDLTSRVNDFEDNLAETKVLSDEQS